MLANPFRFFGAVCLGATVFLSPLMTACTSAQVKILGQPAPASVPVATAKFEPQGNRVYHGAGLPDFWSESGLRDQLNQYAGAAGKRTSVITWFASTYERGVLTNWRQNYVHNLTRVRRMGAASLIKFSTQDYAWNQTRKQADLKAIALGTWDGYFKEMATVMRDFKGPIFLSINHEMNGNWYPYSQEYPGSEVSSADYVASWRRIVQIFRQNGADNVAFVWSPNVPDVGRAGHAQYYPGDDIVDWVGISFYSGNTMSALDGIYKAYSARKPFFITEWATSPQKNVHHSRFPGEVEWVRQFFAALETRYPRVKAISWFNWNKEDGDHRLQRLPEQAEIYSKDVAAARFIEQDKSLINGDWKTQVAPLVKPGNEIVFAESVRVVNPPAQAPPVQKTPVRRTLRDLVKIESVKTETVQTEKR